MLFSLLGGGEGHTFLNCFCLGVMVGELKMGVGSVIFFWVVSMLRIFMMLEGDCICLGWGFGIE